MARPALQSIITTPPHCPPLGLGTSGPLHTPSYHFGPLALHIVSSLSHTHSDPTSLIKPSAQRPVDFDPSSLSPGIPHSTQHRGLPEYLTQKVLNDT